MIDIKQIPLTPLRFVAFPVLISLSVALSAYEDRPQAHVSEILTSKQLQSVYHVVEDVQLVEKEYQFYVETQFAGYNIMTMPLLRDSIREMVILGDAMSQFSRANEELTEELRSFVEIRANSVVDIISRPVQSATNAAGQAVNNLDEAFTGPQYNQRKTYVLQGQGSTDPTFTMHKRNVASQWGLDVYSINPKVQEFLNAVARKRGAGSIASGTPSLGLSHRDKTKMENTEIEFSVTTSLRRNDIDSLYLSNHELITAMHVQSEIRDKFLQHPFYSPSYQTRIIHYLRAIDGLRNVNAFFQEALQANNISEARARVECAMLLAHYHNKAAPIRQLSLAPDHLQAVTKDNELLFFPGGDLLHWDKGLEDSARAVSQRAAKAGFTGTRIITSGTVTARAKQELEKYSITVMDRYGL